MLARQGLDRLQLADVTLGKTAAVGGGALRNHQPQMLVHHQRSRMRLQNLRGNADGIDRLGKRETRGGRRAAGYSLNPSTIPSCKLARVTRALMRYSRAPSREPRAPRSPSTQLEREL